MVVTVKLATLMGKETKNLAETVVIAIGVDLEQVELIGILDNLQEDGVVVAAGLMLVVLTVAPMECKVL
jgi:hypothetical protein